MHLFLYIFHHYHTLRKKSDGVSRLRWATRFITICYPTKAFSRGEGGGVTDRRRKRATFSIIFVNYGKQPFGSLVQRELSTLLTEGLFLLVFRFMNDFICFAVYLCFTILPSRYPRATFLYTRKAFSMIG